jgi:excisionase family DNA binding protein
MNSIAIVLKHIIPALQAMQRDLQDAERVAPSREPPSRAEPPAKEPGTPPAKRLFRPGEAAEYLGISKSSIYQMTSRKEIPFFKIGSRILFREEQLLTWLSGFEHIPGSPSPRRTRRN